MGKDLSQGHQLPTIFSSDISATIYCMFWHTNHAYIAIISFYIYVIITVFDSTQGFLSIDMRHSMYIIVNLLLPVLRQK